MAARAPGTRKARRSIRQRAWTRTTVADDALRTSPITNPSLPGPCSTPLALPSAATLSSANTLYSFYDVSQPGLKDFTNIYVVVLYRLSHLIKTTPTWLRYIVNLAQSLAIYLVNISPNYLLCLVYHGLELHIVRGIIIIN